MRLNDLTISLIDSNYIKNYLVTIKHIFTLEEMATIILNSNITMSTKISILNRMLNTKEIMEYKSDNFEELKADIELIQKDYQYIINACTGMYNSILVCEEQIDDEDCNYFFTSLGALHRKIADIGKESNMSVIIYDGNTSEPVVSIDLDNYGEIMRYDLIKPVNGVISKLYNKYVYIPNDLHRGDIIVDKVSNEKQIVVYEANKLTDSIMDNAEYNNDTSITTVPVYVLDKSSSYKEQIEKILESRIHNIDNDTEETEDIIDIHSRRLHLTQVERAEDTEDGCMQ